MRFAATIFAAMLIAGCAPATTRSPQPVTTAEAPDYANAANWAMREASSSRSADIFYIHPTTYRSEQWNQDMDDRAARLWTDISVTERQLDAFAACCRRFMPYYRQASSRAFSEREGGGDDAYNLAYRDVVAAFHQYMSSDNHGRPFILAGHSQGALHGLRLLKEEIAGTAAQKLLVAAYLPGIGIPFGILPEGIPACRTPAQTGCVASWNSFEQGADTAAYVARSLADYGSRDMDDKLVCTNPLTFDLARPAASFDDGKGARPGPAVAGPLPPLIRGQVAAACKGGVLMVQAKDSLPVERLPGGSYHMADIALFWGDISANARLRAEAWIDKQEQDQ